MAKMAATATTTLKLLSPPKFHSSISHATPFTTFSNTTLKLKLKAHRKTPPITTAATASSPSKSKSAATLAAAKRRTRSDKEFDEDYVKKFGDKASHIPVMLGEVMDVFSPSFSLRSFVDCTLGAAGHSSAIIQLHPEMQTYIGLDVDPIAHEKAQSRINNVLNNISWSGFDLKAHMLLKNFKEIKQVLGQVDEELLTSGVDGILMDLGMSSMQASLKAEDILNSWPETEVGRILRDYGEESNWYFLQTKIVKARQGGGLHSTSELVDLIRRTTCRTKGGRQGWIKTAARVFQALRIAVNDELKTLENALSSSFDCLGPGGRLAVISFHSLEDRLVKQTFLDLINSGRGEGGQADCNEQGPGSEQRGGFEKPVEEEAWIKRIVKGSAGVILTKRPITASAEEERINPRCRSAKLRVIQKIR